MQLVAAAHAPEFLMQPSLRFLSDLEHFWRTSLAPFGKLSTYQIAMPLRPSCFDQHPANVSVAGLRDAASTDPLT